MAESEVYELENAMNSALRLDDPALTQSGTLNTRNDNPHCSSSAFKTPNKDARRSGHSGTSSTKKTPGSAGRRKYGVKGSKTPSSADRFIPNRKGTDFELAHFMLCTQNRESEEDQAKLSPAAQEYKRIMNENLNGDLLSSRILCFKEHPPQAPESNLHNRRVMYSTGKMYNSAKKMTRYIPQVPERILDAPEILDDFYLRLIDWSKQNVLAVSLGSSVYLWDAASGGISALVEYSGNDHAGCVSWTADGNHIALGLSNGGVELWDVNHKKRLRTMTGHSGRVGCLSWNSYILSSGSRSGSIHHHDVRMAEHKVGVLQGHTQEVCGLEWAPSGCYLASGGNDNTLNIWRAGAGSLLTDTKPVYTFNQHQAAVKALAWCPWQRHMLASGGGTADRRINTWNINNGSQLFSVDTKSQVSALLWSDEHRELLSTHGFSQNQLILWKYPAMTKVTELTGHTSRILHACLSPDGTTVVSAGADETLRLWKCFMVDEKEKKSREIAAKKQTETSSCLRFQMR